MEFILETPRPEYLSIPRTVEVEGRRFRPARNLWLCSRARGRKVPWRTSLCLFEDHGACIYFGRRCIEDLDYEPEAAA